MNFHTAARPASSVATSYNFAASDAATPRTLRISSRGRPPPPRLANRAGTAARARRPDPPDRASARAPWPRWRSAACALTRGVVAPGAASEACMYMYTAAHITLHCTHKHTQSPRAWSTQMQARTHRTPASGTTSRAPKHPSPPCSGPRRSECSPCPSRARHQCPQKLQAAARANVLKRWICIRARPHEHVATEKEVSLRAGRL